ncbi:MAG: hypothetical protein ACFE8E_10425 [Candidatus Hodarchaeota archaeon]
MGKTLGIIALIFGIIGVALLIVGVYVSYIFMVLSPFITTPIFLLIILGFLPVAFLAVAIICGAIGIKKDDSRGLAIAGLVIGTLGFLPFVAIIIMNIGPGFIFF